MFSKKRNRRDFIKKSILGSSILLPSIPLLALDNYINFEKHRDRKVEQSTKDEYLIQDSVTHLNTASIGLSPKVVVDAIYESLLDLEKRGRNGDWLVEDIRNTVARLLNSKPQNIAFTRNATEGINIVTNLVDLKEGDEVIISKHEHIGGSLPWIKKAEEKGAIVRLIDLNLNAKKNLELIKEAVNKRTRVISISHVLCTTGMILPVKEIAQFCSINNIKCCIDGAQSMGMIAVDLEEINPDFYVGSGYKWIGGPKGTGILYVKDSILNNTIPSYVGANSDKTFDLNNLEVSYKKDVASREEFGNRNIPLLMGLNAAIDFINKKGIETIEERNRSLVDAFRRKLSKINGIQILTPNAPGSYSSILTFKSDKLDYKSLFEKLRVEKHIRVRKVYENKLEAIRVSFSSANSLDDVDYLSASLEELL